MICGHCQTTLPDGSRYCLSCGADLSDPGGKPHPLDTIAEIRRQLQPTLTGQYELREVAGRGGMATVFLAQDLRLERSVAIKVLPPRLAMEPEFVSRFVREARTAARLDHPNIIPIYAVHSDATVPFFVMKYVAGRSLHDLIDGPPVPIELCQRILVESAAALGHAHAKGVVHRDVKPSNIMIDENGRALLADFGISKALEGSTALTGSGQLVGTAAYMSPEQIKGGQIDGRSDQYSLAVVGHQLLTGRPLFEVGTTNAQLFHHVNEVPRSARALRPEVPESMAEALLKALSKDPRDRFESMAAFAEALWPEHAAVMGTTSTFWTPRPRFATKQRRALAIAGTLAVVVSLALVATRGPAPEVEPAARQSGAAVADSAPPSPTVPPRAKKTAMATRPAAGVGETVRAASSAAEAVPVVGYITIDAQPYGTLSIDNVDVGDTPVVMRAIAPGPHVFRVVRDGYRTWSETIVITAGNVERRPIKLVPLQP